jgi:hypothetical protein
MTRVSTGTTFEQTFTNTQLYLDASGRYTHTVTATGTNFSSYIAISPLTFRRQPGNGPNAWVTTVKDGKEQAYIIDARVIVRGRPYREYDLKTVITDWQK